jgi:hypothetical protein
MLCKCGKKRTWIRGPRNGVQAEKNKEILVSRSKILILIPTDLRLEQLRRMEIAQFSSVYGRMWHVCNYFQLYTPEKKGSRFRILERTLTGSQSSSPQPAGAGLGSEPLLLVPWILGNGFSRCRFFWFSTITNRERRIERMGSPKAAP